MNYRRFDFKNNHVAYIWPDHPLVLAGTILLDDVVAGVENKTVEEEMAQQIAKKYNENYNEVVDYVANIYSVIQMAQGTQKSDVEDIPVELSMATFNITSLCNMRCKHCYASVGRKENFREVTEEEIEVVIKKLAEIVRHPPKLLILSGGEPTLCLNKLIFAIKTAYKYGFNVRVNSNGMIITDELLNILKDCNVLTQISIDGASAKSHALLRGSEESYYLAKQTVSKLVKNNCRVRISMTTHRDNYREIPNVFKDAIESGVEQFITSNLVVTGEARRNGLVPVQLKNEFEVLYNCVKDDKQLQLMTKSTLLAETINAIRAGVKFVNCGTGICTCCVDSDGSIYPCINMVNEKYKIANVLSVNSLNETWNTSEIINQLRKLSVDNINQECSQCIFRYFCGAYCRGETLSGGGSISDPYIRCREWKQALIYVLETLCETPDLYYFNRSSEVEMMERE